MKFTSVFSDKYHSLLFGKFHIDNMRSLSNARKSLLRSNAFGQVVFHFLFSLAKTKV